MPRDTEDHSQDAIEWLFSRTLEDLRELLARPNGISLYELIRTGALLRHLLVEKHCLTERANRAHRLKLDFVAHEFNAGWEATLPPDLIAERQGLVDAGYEQGPVLHLEGVVPGGDDTPLKHLNLGQWRSHVVGQIDDRYATVHDLIDYVANIAGGVHQGLVKTASERSLHFGAEWWMEDATHARISPLAAMFGIATVTSIGLQPLYLACNPQRPA